MPGETVAIVPARAGSVGIPGKNLRTVGGRSLVRRAVEAATAAARVDRVVVTTDGDAIIREAEAAGAETIRRPADLSGSEASSESALLHALTVLEQRSIHVDTVVFVQATSPFITAEEIDAVASSVQDGGNDSAFTAYPSHVFTWTVRDGKAVAIGHDAARRPRRQDREPLFIESGAAYAFRAEPFRLAGHRFFGSIGIVETEPRRSLEIDEPADLEVASRLADLFDAVSIGPVDAVVTDFDGVHTDDGVLIDEEGGETVRVSRADGLGVSLLRRAGIPVLFLSTEVRPLVARRAEKLGVEVIHASSDKAAALAEWAEQNGIDLARTVYLGNDVNDRGCLEAVGWPVVVADAHPRASAVARVRLSSPGGANAVRELADLILHAGGATT